MDMRGIFFCFLIALLPAITGGSDMRAQTAPRGNDTPLPNPNELLQRAIANEEKMATQQEKYACRVRDDTTETDGKGNVKKNESEVKEQFYVNGVEVDRTLAKNGKDLTPEQTQKEDERVMKMTVKYSDQATAKKETDKENKQLQEMMAAMSLANGRRDIDGERSVLYYDIVPNPKFQAKNLNQRFAQVMVGRISIDEET